MNTTFVWLPTVQLRLPVVDYVQILPVPPEVSKYTDLEQDRYRVRVLQDVIRKSKSPGNQDGDAVLFISETRKPARSKDPWANGLAELMGSARLGYAVDYALLYRRMTADEIKQYYGERSAQSLQDDGLAPIMLSLEKGRDGMTRGEWSMQFHFWKSIFEEVEPVPEGQRGLLVLPPEPDEWVEPEETADFEFDSLLHSRHPRKASREFTENGPGSAALPENQQWPVTEPTHVQRRVLQRLCPICGGLTGNVPDCSLRSGSYVVRFPMSAIGSG